MTKFINSNPLLFFIIMLLIGGAIGFFLPFPSQILNCR